MIHDVHEVADELAEAHRPALLEQLTRVFCQPTRKEDSNVVFAWPPITEHSFDPGHLKDGSIVRRL